jgi:hypothetical protein
MASRQAPFLVFLLPGAPSSLFCPARLFLFFALRGLFLFFAVRGLFIFPARPDPRLPPPHDE